MKVLLVHTHRLHQPVHGAAAYMRRLVETLQAEGHECQVVTVLDEAGDAERYRQRKDQLESLGVSPKKVRDGIYAYTIAGVRYLGIVGGAADFSARVWIELRTWLADAVLLSDEIDSHTVNAARRVVEFAPARTVFYLHTVSHLPAGRYALDPSGERLRMLQRAGALVATSEYMREQVREITGRDAEVLYPDTDMMEERGDAPGAVTLINACGFKGIGLFLALARSMPEVEFLAVEGWGTSGTDRRRLASQPNVRLMSWQDTIELVLEQTRVLMVPTVLPESFPIVVIEAMAAGIPVLASDLGGLKESKLGVPWLMPVCEAKPERGAFRIPEQPVAAWREVLERVLNDPSHYREISRRSRDAVAAFRASHAWTEGRSMALLDRLMSASGAVPAERATMKS